MQNSLLTLIALILSVTETHASMYCGAVKSVAANPERVEVDIILNSEAQELFKKLNGGTESKGSGAFFETKKFNAEAVMTAATTSMKDSAYLFCIPAGDGEQPWPKGLGRDFYYLIKK